MNARASENYLAISRSSSASKSVEIFWAEIYWGRLFLFELSFLAKSQKLTSEQKQKFLSVCQKRFNKLKNINISKTSFYYTRVPGFSGIGRTREGTRLQDHLCALC